MGGEVVAFRHAFFFLRPPDLTGKCPAGDGGGVVISASLAVGGDGGAGVIVAFSGAGVVARVGVLTGAGVLTGVVVFTGAGVLTVAGVLNGAVGFCDCAGDFPADLGAGGSFAWVGAGFVSPVPCPGWQERLPPEGAGLEGPDLRNLWFLPCFRPSGLLHS